MGSTPLAGSLVKHNRSGRGNVERTDAAGHGNAQQVIAGAAHQVVKPRALAAQHDNKIAGKVKSVVVAFAALVQTDDPQVLAFEFFERANQVDDAGNAKMLRRAGTGLYGSSAQRRGAALGKNHAVNPGAIGHAQQRAQILRVFHSVESQHETRCGRLAGSRHEEILERKKLLRVHQRDHALMRQGLRGNRKLFARLLENADASLAALGNQPFKARVVPLARHQNVVKAPLPGFQSLLHRVQSVENFHEVSLRPKTQRAPPWQRPEDGKLLSAF